MTQLWRTQALRVPLRVLMMLLALAILFAALLSATPLPVRFIITLCTTVIIICALLISAPSLLTASLMKSARLLSVKTLNDRLLRPCLFFISTLLSALLPASAVAGTTPLTLLQNMEQASKTLDYDMAFITISPQQGVESMRYRHAMINNQPVAQLLQMDGPRREVVQRSNEISYFDPGLEPYTLTGNHIIDSLPALVYANFSRLSLYYDFISMGRTRIADSLCEVVRIVPRDGTRYSYVAWLDIKTHLPLRVDLLDMDGEPLEQFGVVAYTVGTQPDPALVTLHMANLPPLLALPATSKQHFNWQAGWLPAGFTEMSSSLRPISGQATPVESRLYSDGLFSFSLNIGHATGASSNQVLRTGRRTVVSQVDNDVEISVVGELPPATARRIASSVKFRASP